MFIKLPVDLILEISKYLDLSGCMSLFSINKDTFNIGKKNRKIFTRYCEGKYALGVLIREQDSFWFRYACKYKETLPYLKEYLTYSCNTESRKKYASYLLQFQSITLRDKMNVGTFLKGFLNDDEVKSEMMVKNTHPYNNICIGRSAMENNFDSSNSICFGQNSNAVYDNELSFGSAEVPVHTIIKDGKEYVRVRISGKLGYIPFIPAEEMDGV